jgi:copper chaperone CopZ
MLISLRCKTAASTTLLVLLSAALGACPDSSPTPTPRAIVRTTFEVKGMTCSGCETAITTALSAIEGVTEARASHGERRVWVDHEPAKASAAELETAIEKLGYKAALLHSVKAPR